MSSSPPVDEAWDDDEDVSWEDKILAHDFQFLSIKPPPTQNKQPMDDWEDDDEDYEEEDVAVEREVKKENVAEEKEVTNENVVEEKEDASEVEGDECSICLENILPQETALIKGCDHAYCVNCILRWASYKKEPTCPQCNHRFQILNIHRTLDGSIHEDLSEESVCLLLRAKWYKPLVVRERMDMDEWIDHYYDHYARDEEALNETYLGRSPSLWIGNRGGGGHGRQEARPIPVRNSNRQNSNEGPSRQPKKKETTPTPTDTVQENVGRRAKRALKREAADVAAAAKHQERLIRMGRKKVEEPIVE